MNVDVCVIGGGIAGLSLAYELAATASVAVVEREPDLAYHSTGRSAALYSETFFDGPALLFSRASRPFLRSPPADFAPYPLHQDTEILLTARAADREALHALGRRLPGLRAIGRKEIGDRLPYIRMGENHVCEGAIEPHAFRIDVAGLVAGYRRVVRERGGQIVCDAGSSRIDRIDGRWCVVPQAAEPVSATVLVDAAGAWGDLVAEAAGLEPVGLRPMARTMITFEGPAGVDCSGWPMAGAIDGSYYFGPEAGHLMGSAADETPSAPCDVQPDEYGVALAAHNIERHVTFPVARIRNKWAGLRTFSPDRQPVIGFPAAGAGFFWFAGQGGFGIQAAPMLARFAASLIRGESCPPELTEQNFSAASVSPDRFAR